MLSARGFKVHVHGQGEPVLFIHGTLIADTFLPLIAAPALSRYQRSRITQPTLSVIGTESGRLFDEGQLLCRDWIPQTETFSVKGARHHLHYQDADCSSQAARGISEFLQRHGV